MTNIGHDLFLLSVTLAQLKTKSQIIRLFIEGINCVFERYTFVWYNHNDKVLTSGIEVCTRLKTFGYVEIIPDFPNEGEPFTLLQNLCQVVAILLEKTEQEEILADKELKLKNLLDTNVSNLHQTEKELFETNEIFHYFMLNSPIYVFFKDSAIRSLRLSKNYENMLERPIEELIGKTMDDLFPSDLAKKMIADDLKILNGGKPAVFEEELNGRYYTTIKFPIAIDGKPKYLAGYTIDITDKKLSDLALTASEERWRTLVQTLPDFIALHDCEGRFLFLNHYADGFSEVDIIGKSASEFIADISKNDFKNAFKECVSLQKRLEIEYTAYGNNNELRKYECVLVPLFENGDVAMVLAVARDITERDLAESTIKSKADELERFNNLMVGRELKMIELKKEVNELLKNSGKKEKYKISE